MKQRDQENDTDAEKEMIPQVFSELLVYLIETKTNAVDPVVFRLADLVSLYQQRLQQLGVKDHNINSTRLKDKLLGEKSELKAYKKGRDVLLAFKEDVGTVLSKAINYTEAAKILRQRMMDHKSSFTGTFNDECVENSIPSTLLQFVSMIEHGADIKSQLRLGASKTDLAMSQLLQYNCYKKMGNCCDIPKTERHLSQYFWDCPFIQKPGRNI